MRETFFGPYARNEARSFASVERFLNRASAVLSDEWRPRRVGWLAPGPRRWCARVCLAGNVFFRNGWAFRKKGILRADGFVDEIDRLLRASPQLRDEPGLPPPPPGGRHLTFHDLRARPKLGMVPLFLMVTDVSAQGLKIVSSVDDTSLDLPIALAVRASASFPIFFQPIALDTEHLCCIDGGVISNVPTWVFSDAFRGRLRTTTSRHGPASLANTCSIGLRSGLLV